MLSDPLLLAQSIKVTNWLTPVWIMSVGISIGYLLVLLMLLKIYFFQRMGGFNGVTENPTRRWVVGALTALVYFGIFVGFMFWFWGGGSDGEWVRKRVQDGSLWLPLAFAIPVCWMLGFGVWRVVSRRMAGELSDLAFHGFLSWVNKVCWVMVVFAVLGFALAPVNGLGVVKFVDDPVGMMKSLARIPFTGGFEREFQIEPSPAGHTGDRLDVAFDGAELQFISFQSDRRLELSAAELTPDNPSSKTFSVDAIGEPTSYFQRSDGTGYFPAEPIDGLFVNNLGSQTANLQLKWVVAPIYREVVVIPVIALVVISIYLAYLIFASSMPKTAAIAFSTFKTEVSQPLFLIVMALGVAFILGTIFVPYNTFGEDIKMYKDSGLTLIRVLAIFLAVWAASKSVAEEIEGRTALTVLSKPVGRRQFIFGKFTGISLAIAVMFIVVGLWFYVWVSYKPIYDNQESAKGVAEWSVCFVEAIHVLPGLFLCFLEVVIFVAISVAVSTRFGILANFLICFSIYVLGHLTPLLVQSSLGAFETVAVFGQLISIVFPVLNHFDVQAAINTNTPVPLAYLAWAVIYTGLYSTMAMLLALVMFEDRDLA